MAFQLEKKNFNESKQPSFYPGKVLTSNDGTSLETERSLEMLELKYRAGNGHLNSDGEGSGTADLLSLLVWARLF